jgi:hypothetical protein
MMLFPGAFLNRRGKLYIRQDFGNIFLQKAALPTGGPDAWEACPGTLRNV